MKNPFLVGDTIYLRTIEESDLTDDYKNWFNDEEICRFNSHHRFPNYRENMLDYYNNVIKSGDNIVLAIIDKESDKHIGNISLQDIDRVNRKAELAIIIGDKEFWGRGVGKEAAALIILHGFQSLNLHRIYCGASIGNIAMQKLAESLGFHQEGVFRQCFFKNGVYQDSVNYGLLESEYEKK